MFDKEYFFEVSDAGTHALPTGLCHVILTGAVVDQMKLKYSHCKIQRLVGVSEDRRCDQHFPAILYGGQMDEGRPRPDIHSTADSRDARAPATRQICS